MSEGRKPAFWVAKDVSGLWVEHDKDGDEFVTTERIQASRASTPDQVRKWIARGKERGSLSGRVPYRIVPVYVTTRKVKRRAPEVVELARATLDAIDWMNAALAAYEGDPSPSETQGKNACARLCAAVDALGRGLAE